MCPFSRAVIHKQGWQIGEELLYMKIRSGKIDYYSCEFEHNSLDLTELGKNGIILRSNHFVFFPD